MDQILGQILRQAVWERLDLLDELADRADAQSLVSVARTELPRLTEGWRTLLAAHEPNAKGRCPECSTRWRPRVAPCTVWRTAHRALVAAEAAVQATAVPVTAVQVTAVQVTAEQAKGRTTRAATRRPVAV